MIKKRQTVIFRRDNGFFPVEVFVGDDLAHHAELNPGTLAIEDIFGNVLWHVDASQITPPQARKLMAPMFPFEDLVKQVSNDPCLSAASLIQFFQFPGRTGSALYTFCIRHGIEIPDWLELYIPNTIAVPGPERIALVVYRLMVQRLTDMTQSILNTELKVNSLRGPS